MGKYLVLTNFHSVLFLFLVLGYDLHIVFVGYADNGFQGCCDLVVLNHAVGHYHLSALNSSGRFHNNLCPRVHLQISRGKIVHLSHAFKPDSNYFGHTFLFPFVNETYIINTCKICSERFPRPAFLSSKYYFTDISSAVSAAAAAGTLAFESRYSRVLRKQSCAAVIF